MEVSDATISDKTFTGSSPFLWESRCGAQQQSREECGGTGGHGKEDGARCARVMSFG